MTLEASIEKIPREIDILSGTLEQMKNAAGPDRTAAYWDERHKIESDLEQLEVIEVAMVDLIEKFQDRKAEG